MCNKINFKFKHTEPLCHIFSLYLQEKEDEGIIIQQNAKLQKVIDDSNNISSMRDSKAATLEEAKQQLANIRNDRIKAEEHEAPLQVTAREQKQMASDVSNVLHAIKKENGKFI